MPLSYAKPASEEERRRRRVLQARAARFGCSIEQALASDPTASDDEIGTYRVWDDEAHITAACAEGGNYGLTLDQIASWLDEEGRSHGDD